MANTKSSQQKGSSNTKSTKPKKEVSAFTKNYLIAYNLIQTLG